MKTKTIFEDIINKGGYNLGDMISKIDLYHIEGKLTTVEKEELTLLARNKVDMDGNVDIWKKLQELDERVKTLEADSTTNPTDEYPPYTEGKWYYNGDKCSENNQNYICTAPSGVVCVWSPSAYPAYWELVK